MFPFIDELDDEQRTAATAESDAVVSAGAGSGKTRVLAARYGWLVMTGRCKVEQILTITFTNKAANEMYRRIYSLLSENAPHNEHARAAIENFHKAHISTLDSFCSVIARAVCRRFGISPDFESNDVRVRELARSLALRFVLDKRNNPALQHLIAENKMRFTADELFAHPVLYHSPISRPLDFKEFEKKQREEILCRWKEFAGLADSQIALIRENHSGVPPKTVLADHLAAVLPKTVKAPGIEGLFTEDPSSGGESKARDSVAAYMNFLADLVGFTFRSSKKSEAVQIIKEAADQLKAIYEKLLALANHALQWDIVTAVFPLIEEFQTLLNTKKREGGILTFTDIAHLAVDGLRQYSDIRQMYQGSFRMIMIDEFQDNNSLQRDLVDLLSDPAKVFYVGDEKQSIYRFRGADVSVFRGLANHAECKLSLNRNYRSHPALITAFNRIFGGYRSEADPQPAEGVFPPDGIPAEDFEANYRWIKSRDQTSARSQAGAESKKNNSGHEEPRLHFAFFDKGCLAGSDDSLRAEDYEARYIAQTIKTLVSGRKLFEDKDSGETRPCTYGDFAVLQRSHTHQRALERAFKLFGVPFAADRPAALFDDAPVNDMWAILKLLVYPDDRITYGALLRSPFVRMSEDAFTLCMLEGRGIFDPSLDEKLPPADCRRYRAARQLYGELLQDARDLPVSSLITKLWYKQGYRHEALWSASTQVYLNLYDLFFEQAQTIEDQGKGLVDFLDYLEDLASKKEKFDDVALPGEEESGVRIMTIHRCKGLEFPIVFVYGCGSREDVSLNRGLTFYSEHWGVVLQLPQAEELDSGEDYFYLAEKDQHRAKSVAELKRLLYVAMTRAEQELYVTAIIPPQNKGEREDLNPEEYKDNEKEFIVRRLEQYKANPNLQSASFLLLLPDLDGENLLYTVEAISSEAIGNSRLNAARGNSAGDLPLSELSLEENALQVAGDYETIPLVPPYQFIPRTISASSLKVQPAESSFIQSNPTEQADPSDEALDKLISRAGLEPQNFGTIVHSFIEARFNGLPQRIPSRFAALVGDAKNLEALASAAQTMADGFFDSPLGRKAAAAAGSFLRTEYPILTVVNHGNTAQGKTTVLGKIDLIFDNGDAMYVVDFKTDREEDITRHIGQLAVYKRAAEDIFGKPVECRLFYLRKCLEADLTKEITNTSVEELTVPAITCILT